MKRSVLLMMVTGMQLATVAQQQPADTTVLSGGKLIVSTDFSGQLDPTQWIVEMAPAPNSSV